MAIPSSGSALFDAAGGLGLFLLGMGLMTEALRSLAGNRLRRTLLRCTRSAWSGAAAGAIVTGLLQSSTATTVATVGFVSAGLLSFQASLGIIFGANVGSTGLGWLVALLGIRFNLARLMLPAVLLGATLRLLGRGRRAQAGQALAGLALLFVGLEALQAALAGRGLLLDPSQFDASAASGRLQLLLLGVLSTVITHSSGAGVAASLAALSTGALALPQACALVIGMDVGTTVTALVASLGASLSARRTAAAHVVFNLLTAVAAFLLLPGYLGLLARLAPALQPSEAAFALTAFHTGFNLLGVLLVLPISGPFAALIRRLVRPLQPRSVDALSDSPPRDTAAAVGQAYNALAGCFLELAGVLLQALRNGQADQQGLERRLGVLQADLDRVEVYLDQVHLRPELGDPSQALQHLLHGLDHLQRLHERCEEEQDRLLTAATSAALKPETAALVQLLERLLPLIDQRQWRPATSQALVCQQDVHQRVASFRAEVLRAMAAGELDGEDAVARLEAMRWLDRVSRHLERVCNHLAQAAQKVFDA